MGTATALRCQGVEQTFPEPWSHPCSILKLPLGSGSDEGSQLFPPASHHSGGYPTDPVFVLWLIKALSQAIMGCRVHKWEVLGCRRLGDELLCLAGECLGVYLWLTPAFLTLPEPLDHLHGTVISSSGLWWSAVAWRDLFCPCLSGVFPPWQG